MLASNFSPHTPQAEANRQANLGLIDRLRTHWEESCDPGKAKYIERAKQSGKMLARERIDLLIDPHTPFLELLPLAGLGKKGNIALGGTMIGGIGLISGVVCLITANIPTIKGGTIDVVTLQKGFRLNEIARENRLPVVHLVESGGANLPEQAQIFNHGGQNFRDITRRSKAGIPTISVVFGNSTAGGAYIPGMSDYSIFVKDQAKVFLAGPPLVYMATQEVVDDESLGGADMHSKVSGVSDYLAESEADGIRMARKWIHRLKPVFPTHSTSTDWLPPKLPAEDLLGIIPSDLKTPFDVREIIGRLVDGSEFDEFKPDYGETLVCGFADIMGHPVGILANNGVLFSSSAQKGAHFIQLCNRQRTPLIFLQNITGFMVGERYETGGIIKHGAQLINAVSNSEVPSITLMIGASYGAGNYAMNGRAFQPRFLFAWPNAKIAVMGSEQLGGVMEIIQRQAAKKAGREVDEQQLDQMKQMMQMQVDRESDAFYASGQLWDDGIIDPRDSRHVLGFCLSVIHQQPISGADSFGVFRF
ncbi:carboxyl transferase domain-containing protein [Pontibacter sp. G13]|uniref:acyl-CoA carboxylase subunit beta n=1 Tax=Pontibacter sp. G13 TaxID=3074898 RepID=UPI002889C279|nr:carboxyl transferase domain-containing protein [Pontibacter sp. G13]WNJ19824.1 carboxyl transferase domain-containing protein [Pontibacter sp. G13]